MRASWNIFVKALLLFVLLLSVKSILADTAGPYKREHRSANGQFLLNVAWEARGKTHLTLKHRTANGLEKVWTITSPQEMPPISAFITEDGRYVVLLDQWPSVGRGKVLAFVGPAGRALKAYELEQILTQEEILRAQMTVSSLWWSRNAQFFFLNGQTQFALITEHGTLRLFDLATGNHLPVTPLLADQIRRERITEVRQGLSSKDPNALMTAIRQIAVLHDLDSVPRLTALLDDPTFQTVQVANKPGIPDGTYKDYPIQWVAGEALVTLLGNEASDLIGDKVRNANPYMLKEWTYLLVKTDSPNARAILHQLAASKQPRVRNEAMEALLKAEKMAFLKDNLSLLQDKDSYMRFQALLVLIGHATKDEAPLLRQAMQDSDPILARGAFLGLIRLDLPDLPALLRQSSRQQQNHLIAEEAQRELARRGDQAELQRLVTWIRDLRTSPKQAISNIDEICLILLMQRPKGLEDALREAIQHPYIATLYPINGVLAALGDAQALGKLRQYAQKGPGLDRADAIKWLGICKDRGSEALLRAALTDEEGTVRGAAQEALAKLGSRP